MVSRCLGGSGIQPRGELTRRSNYGDRKTTFDTATTVGLRSAEHQGLMVSFQIILTRAICAGRCGSPLGQSRRQGALTDVEATQVAGSGTK